MPPGLRAEIILGKQIPLKVVCANDHIIGVGVQLVTFKVGDNCRNVHSEIRSQSLQLCSGRFLIYQAP